jgi:hypothetical protein
MKRFHSFFKISAYKTKAEIASIKSLRIKDSHPDERTEGNKEFEKMKSGLVIED